MPFIRFRKIKYDPTGKIVSGTAAIIDVKYVPDAGKYHSKQVVREKLGKVKEIYGKKSGLFLSPTRGLVVYDSSTDSFSKKISKEEANKNIENSEVVEDIFNDQLVHVVFGDVYFLIEFIKKINFLNVLRVAFPDKIFFQRLLCHIFHGTLKDGARITCDDFVYKSFASYIVEDIPLSSLKSDTYFYSEMGRDDVKLEFFKAYITEMKKEYPNFGKSCYIDSTPLPNDINSPFSCLCSHGLSGTAVQMRLILIIDEETTYPLWFDIIPGNVLDINTLKSKTKDVEISLGIEIISYVLDAGYVSQELIHKFDLQEDEQLPEKRFIARMPARKGYPHRSLYSKYKSLFINGKYDFIREGHTYFGKACQTQIFNKDVMCYVYVDYINAVNGYSEYLKKHIDEFLKKTDKDKTWIKIKSGFFVLLSNCRKSPAEILDDFFCRCSIEGAFKNDKEYLKMLPLRKWSIQTVRGKILCDVIDSIIRQKLLEKKKGISWSLSAMIGKSQSLMCMKDMKSNTVFVEPPCKQVKECFKQFELEIPSEIDLSAYVKGLFAG